MVLLSFASREIVEIELRRRSEARANLERLRKRHEADKESARRTYMESKRCVSRRKGVRCILHIEAGMGYRCRAESLCGS